MPMGVLREVLLLVLLYITWITTVSATCQSTEIVDGKKRCVVECGWGDRVCECEVGYDECELTMTATQIKTFASYQVLGVKPNQILGSAGTVYNLDNVTGEPIPVINSTCKNYIDNSTFCITPNWVDGKNYKVVYTLNGVIPSPTIIMDQDATLIAHIVNGLTNEATSIHWHGIEQFNTPWMDGVGQITQCSIAPSTTFTYAFVGTVPGTFWYHSHTGTQRADGMFGGIIVRENNKTKTEVAEAFESLGVGPFLDYPDRHTIVISDWFESTSIDDIEIANPGLRFYPDIPVYEVPMSTDTTYSSTFSYDGGEVGPAPYFSSLINGLGREESVPYISSRLSEFRVERGNVYRFRLIGAQSLYAFRFSIDGHNLTTIATDSYFIEPIEEVNYIIIHSGERYDFLLNATAVISNYIIRIETLEAEPDCFANAPFPSLNHYTEAILHYETAPMDNGVPSTSYESISMNSPMRNCTMGPRCRAVNCPFENFHTSYGIDCINVDNFRLLIETPAEDLPEAYATDNDHLFFWNLNFEGEGFSGSINGRRFVLPPYPPQVQQTQFGQYSDVCDDNQDCSAHPSNQYGCICTHQVEIDYDKTVQIVVSAEGRFLNSHPMHIHGHTFQVLKVGYPSYYDRNGYVNEQNPDIDCNQLLQLPNVTGQCTERTMTCTNPSWSDPSPLLNISSKTPRKDTVIIPAGGYVVLNFKSDNPGYWFAHCHIEIHQIQGMAILIEEASNRHNPAPDELTMCTNYIFNSGFYEKLQFNPNQAETIQVSILSLLMSMLALLIVF
ncbi:L-ascorbate oxidase-like [Oopsacas minuta]|uniref:L-ascorbate oxidase-like n=1 Tax=Oopsacas minuta TaxID=111878 RepID=A0AAV7JPP9_9METZ|nr:L-ascorbate oxidase-like [Oopsacas minuta]